MNSYEPPALGDFWRRDSLEHIVSGGFNLQRPLFFNIHRERLYAAEPPCMTRIRTIL